MPIKGPRDANPRKPIREIRKKKYTERGRSVEIHRFLTRAKELFFGNLKRCLSRISLGKYEFTNLYSSQFIFSREQSTFVIS